jgi:selenocysteine lyase/cysteine desulfurase
MLHEESLMRYAEYILPTVPGLRLIGNPGHRTGSISLMMEGIEPQRLGKFLDGEGIAVRSRCGPVTTAPNPHLRTMAWPKRFGRPWRSITRTRRSTRW